MTKRSTEQWLSLFKQHDSSGLTASQFCRDNNLCPKYFSKRKQDLNWTNQAAPFVPAVVKPLAPSNHAIIRLYVGSNKMELPTSLSPTWLAELLKALS